MKNPLLFFLPQVFANLHARIKHQLDAHARISGQICPYCTSRFAPKKFDDLDGHVAKYHLFEMHSPIQTCSTCKINFGTYEELRDHRQLHEGGNKRVVEIGDSSGQDGKGIEFLIKLFLGSGLVSYNYCKVRLG